jgi:hypothetical protein
MNEKINMEGRFTQPTLLSGRGSKIVGWVVLIIIALVIYFTFVGNNGRSIGHVVNNGTASYGSSTGTEARPGAHREPHYVLVKNEEVMLSNKQFVIDLRDGDGQYAIEFSLTRSGSKCMVWSPECMKEPIVLGDLNNIDVGPETKTLRVWQYDRPEKIRYKLWAIR